jgi:hypothetical protein
VIVYLLWHVSHSAEDEIGNVCHRDGGETSIREDEGDEVALLGIYSSRVHAERRIARARVLPGSRNAPECLLIGEYTLDRDE